jgi:hypothetical protein
MFNMLRVASQVVDLKRDLVPALRRLQNAYNSRAPFVFLNTFSPRNSFVPLPLDPKFPALLLIMRRMSANWLESMSKIAFAFPGKRTLLYTPANKELGK